MTIHLSGGDFGEHRACSFDATDARPQRKSVRRSVAQCIDAPAHVGPIQGALHVGEASRDGKLVQIGVFPDGRVRFRATTCASLIAYAEVACEALESGVSPFDLDASAIRSPCDRHPP